MADTAPLAFEFDAHFQKLFKSLGAMESKVANDLKRINGTFEASNRKVTESLNRSAQSMQRFGNLTGSQRFVLQSTAAQFGDLAVQIGSGTDPMRAMGQQLPQLLGGFGALGGTLGVIAPLLGTVAAIGLPLASFFIGMAAGSQDAADKAETLADKTKLLEQATADYLKAAEANKATVGELREEYGTLADEVKRALEIQTELTLAAQKRAQSLTAGGVLQAVSGGIPELGGAGAVEAVLQGYDALIAKRKELLAEFSNPTSDPNSADNDIGLPADLAQIDAQIAMLDRVKQSLAELAEQYGITTEQAGQMVTAAVALSNADPGAAQVEAAARLNAVLIDIFGSAAAVEEKFGGVQAALAEIVQRGAEVVQATNEAGLLAGIFRDAMAQASAVLDGVAGKYGPIIANIDAAAKAAWNWASAMAAAVSAGQAAGSLDAAGNATNLPSGSRGRSAPPKPPAELGIPALPRGGGGGGGGGGRTIDKQQAADLAKAKSLYESTRTAAEQYAAQLAEINRLHAAGKIDADTAARATDALNEKFRQGIFDAREFKAALKSAFVDLVTGAESLEDALSNLLGKLAEMAASSAFDMLFNGGGTGGAAGSGGGGFMGWLGGLLGFDGGGYTGNGSRSGGLDGKGGFLAMMHPRETVIDHTRGQGGGGMMLNVSVFGATGNEEIRSMVSQGIKTALTGYDRKVLPGRFESINRDSRRRN